MKKIKRLFAVILLLFTACVQLANAQSMQSQMQNFFSYKNNRAYWWLSKFAHPLNIFQSGYCEVRGDNVYVTINSKSNTALFKIHKSGSIFDSIETVEDSDTFDAFWALNVAKDIIVDFWRSFSTNTIAKIEKAFGVLDYLSGENMCLAVLTALFWQYPNNSSYSGSNEIPRNKRLKLRGYVGDYPITMSFIVKENHVTGSYYYNRKGPDHVLTLYGVAEDDTIYLIEENEYGEETGRFIGTYYDGVYEGYFRTSKGKEYPFIIE